MPKKAFEAAAGAQAQINVQLKDDQPTLMRQVESVCCSAQPASIDTTVTKGRHRHETRTVEVFSATSSVAATEWEPLIKDIVRVNRDVVRRDPKTGLWRSASEIAYYVVNCPISAHRAAAAIPSHGHVQNKLHYTRDDTFQEDQSRFQHNAGVFARLRSFAYNLLRRYKISTFSQDRYAAAPGLFNALYMYMTRVSLRRNSWANCAMRAGW